MAGQDLMQRKVKVHGACTFDLRHVRLGRVLGTSVRKPANFGVVRCHVSARGEWCDRARHAIIPSMISNPCIKVFVAEDSLPIRQRVTALLDAAHLEVIGAGATPAACIEGILRSHPDVVVLDHQLEGGSGLQVLRAVHSAAPDVAFVVFSNNAADAYRRRYVGEGASCFLDKCADIDRLAAAVTSAARGTVH
jgi:CheY-like chemotaxis protein